MKKVMHLISTDSFSGAENVSCQIINGFKNNKDYEMYYVSVIGNNKENLIERNVNYYELKKFNYSEIKKAVKELKPDIIHAHDAKSSIFAALFFKKCKIISHIHGNHENMRKITLKTLLYNFFSHCYEKIIWVSDSALDNYYFRKKILDKSIVLYNVIDPNEMKERANKIKIKEKYDLVYVGRLTYAKNPTRLVNVISIVKKSLKDIKLVIVGDGELREEVEKEMENKSLKDSIFLVGFQDNPAPYMKNAKIMLMTSRYEGTPMCVLEAISLGLPIVSTPTDGICKIIENGENGFLSDSDEKLAENIVTLLNNKKLYDKFVKSINDKNMTINNIDEYIKKIKAIYD